MWARRCGAPPKWPSRAKVVLHSFFTAACGMTIYNFLQLADVNYLNIDNPLDARVMCLNRWPLRHDSGSWFDQDQWEDWVSVRTDTADFMAQHACSAASEPPTCAEVRLPLQALKRKLGVPLNKEFQYQNDVLEMYSYLFLFITVWLWLAVLSHDLTLLSVRNRNYILDWSGINKSFPKIFRLFRLTGLQHVLRGICGSCSSRASSRHACAAACLVLAPVLLAWGLLVFLLACIPLVILSFLRYPIRLSRVSIFMLCICFGAYGIILTGHTLAMVLDQAARPAYAVTWLSSAEDGTDCTCGCSYPLSRHGCAQMVLMGVMVTFQGLMLACRCLKGLRRSNWANLMSVTFAVPLTVYAVEWMARDGAPIRYRSVGQAVQGEPAFDPFALMDEQPNSAKTTVNLRPVQFRNPSEPEGPKRLYEGPKLASCNTMHITDMEYVGCCGFPCRTGGLQGRFVTGDTDSETEDAEAQTKPPEAAAQQDCNRSRAASDVSACACPGADAAAVAAPQVTVDTAEACAPRARFRDQDLDSDTRPAWLML